MHVVNAVANLREFTSFHICCLNDKLVGYHVNFGVIWNNTELCVHVDVS